MRMREIVAVMMTVASVTHTSAATVTLKMLSSGPAEKTGLYAIGVFDAADVYANALGIADKWADCLDRLKITAKDAVEGAIELGRKHPRLAEQPAAAVMLMHINLRCGFITSIPDQ